MAASKKIFIVLSHPEPTSFNHALAETARTTLEAEGHSVQVSDLYAMGFDPINDRRNFTTVKNPDRLAQAAEENYAAEHNGFNPQIKAEMDKLEWCDVLIFQCPINWFGLPAMLKAWVDKVFASGFAYGGGRWYETGMFRGKKAFLSITTGAPEFMFKEGHIQGDINQILFPVTHGMFFFTGFTPLESHVVYSAAHGSDDDRRAYLEAYAAKLRDLDAIPAIPYPTTAEIWAAHKK